MKNKYIVAVMCLIVLIVIVLSFIQYFSFDDDDNEEDKSFLNNSLKYGIRDGKYYVGNITLSKVGSLTYG